MPDSSRAEGDSAEGGEENGLSDIAKCRGEGCTVPVLFAISNETGARIPLDTRAPVYRVERGEDGVVRAIRERDCYVTHYASCRAAGQFSRKGKP